MGHQYLLYNPDQGVYLYDNGSTGDARLAVSATVPSTNYDNYLWEFSATTAGKIKNVGTRRWISRNDAAVTTTDSESGAETFTKGNYGTSTFYLRSTYRSRSGWSYYNHHLDTDSGLVTLRIGTSTNSTNRATSLWTLREMKTTSSWSVPAGASLRAEAYHSADLTYINELGSPVPLERIDRNQNLQVGVNIFYNPQTGSFNFDVVPWTNVEGGATFD